MARPSFTTRLRAAFRMVFPGAGGGERGWSGFMSRLWGALPGSQLNIARDIGDPAQNSAVAICLGWIADQFTEPVFEVAEQQADKTWKAIEDHPIPALVRDPNPFYDGDALWGSTITSLCVDGNAYWIKARGMAGAGRPVELYYIPHWQVEPRWDTRGDVFLSHYDYIVDGKAYHLPREAVVHFYDKIDPIRRKGVSRLYPALRSVGADNEADTFVFAILKNMGIPGVLISPRDPAVTIDQVGRDELKSIWDTEFTGDNRGKAMVPNVAVEVTKLAFSPEELALERIREVPLQRICASLRLNPLVVGLGPAPKGLDNGGQHKATRRAGYEDCVVPLQKRVARTVTRQLGPDFDLQPNQLARWNYDDVDAMQEDKDLLAARIRQDYAGGVIMRSEARQARGYSVEPERDEVFVASVAVVPADDLEAQKPQPPALPESDDDEQRRNGRRERRRALPAGSSE